MTSATDWPAVNRAFKVINSMQESVHREARQAMFWPLGVVLLFESLKGALRNLRVDQNALTWSAK